MEGMNISENKSIKSEEKLNLQELDILISKDQSMQFVKNDFKVQNLASSASNNCIKIEEKEKIVKSNQVSKKKVIEDGVTIERVLSEGEASSDFETISSLDSNYDIENLYLGSSNNADDFNIIVEIENELAFQNSKNSIERLCYTKDRNNTFNKYKNSLESFSGNCKSRQNDGFKNFRKRKYGQNNRCINMNDKNDRRDKNSNEREEFSHSRWDSPMIHDRSRSRSKKRNRSRSKSRSRSRNCSKSRFSRSSDRENRSQYSRSSEHTSRSRSSRSLEKNGRCKSPSCKDRKTEERRSECFDKNSEKSYPERNSSTKKRTTKYHSSSVWYCLSSDEIKKKINSNDRAIRNCWNNSSGKKEQITFVTELGRKLKEAERFENFSEEAANGSLVPIPEPSSYAAMPKFSLDNLPLVPGPNGLPVYITVTGEQILHDMDGRRIPIGPNGHYLPVDPMGRLFPHIVSPRNQAVPIHITEDGIIRLPNSEPIPYGPGHQFPVNIDGSIIYIGPDSRPLYPCSNLPIKPPPLLQTMESSDAGHVAQQEVAEVTSQLLQTVNQQNFVIESQQTQITNSTDSQSSRANLSLLEFLQNSYEKINKADLIKRYKKKAQERNEEALRCPETEKNFSSNSLKGVKRSIPLKLLQKKTFRADNCNCSSDSVLQDTGDSDSIFSSRPLLEPNKDASKETVINSNDNKYVLGIVYDSKNQKTRIRPAKKEDPIIKRIHRAIKSLCEKNYRPPAFGRFIITNIMTYPVVKNFPNESPLVRNRIQLPFLIPKAREVPSKDQPIIAKKTAVNFKFLPQKKSFEKGEKLLDFECNKTSHENYDAAKNSILTFDFAMQCDFTSAIIKNLSSKVSDLEAEVIRLKKVNTNLLDGYRNVQAMNQKKNDQLRKFALEIEEKNNEIQALKRFLEKRQ